VISVEAIHWIHVVGFAAEAQADAGHLIVEARTVPKAVSKADRLKGLMREKPCLGYLLLFLNVIPFDLPG
ncbi:unnamed protein product, partial [marine sediment metagenome]